MWLLRKIWGLCALVLAFTTFAATPASALISFSHAEVGVTKTVTFNGLIEGVETPGLTGAIEYTILGVSNGARDWELGFKVINTSSAPIEASRISAFGFNTDAGFQEAFYTGGTVYTTFTSGNVPGYGVVGFCGTAGPNCAGGGGGGTLIGTSNTGAVILRFSQPLTTFGIFDPVVRYQSIYSSRLGLDDASGIGLGSFSPTGGVPEPTSWAMMITGFGLIGLTRRLRNRAAVAI